MKLSTVEAARRLQSVSKRGATTARCTLQRFFWWRRILDLALHTCKAFLLDVRTQWTTHTQKQAKTFDLVDFPRLIGVAFHSSGAVLNVALAPFDATVETCVSVLELWVDEMLWS